MLTREQQRPLGVSAAAPWLLCIQCVARSSLISILFFVSVQTTLPTRRRCSPSATSDLVSVHHCQARTTAAGLYSGLVIPDLTMVALRMLLFLSSGWLGPSSATTGWNVKRLHRSSSKTKEKTLIFGLRSRFYFCRRRTERRGVTAAFWVFLTSRVTLQTHLLLLVLSFHLVQDQRHQRHRFAWVF